MSEPGADISDWDGEDLACAGLRRADRRSDFLAEITGEDHTTRLLHALAMDCFAAARYCPSEAESGKEYLAAAAAQPRILPPNESMPAGADRNRVSAAIKRKRMRAARIRPPDGLRTKAEAAAKLGCSIKTVDGHVDAGALRYVIVGHGKKRPRKMFADADLTAFIEAQTRKEAPCPSTASPARPIGIPTSSGAVIAFTDLRKQRPGAKPKK